MVDSLSTKLAAIERRKRRSLIRSLAVYDLKANLAGWFLVATAFAFAFCFFYLVETARESKAEFAFHTITILDYMKGVLLPLFSVMILALTLHGSYRHTVSKLMGIVSDLAGTPPALSDVGELADSDLPTEPSWFVECIAGLISR